MDKKICCRCNFEKDLDKFAKDRNSKDGLTYQCKDCRNKKYNEFYRDNPDKKREVNLRKRGKRKEFYQSERGIQSSRKSHLKRKFGITLEQYDSLLQQQDGVCAICKKPEKCDRNSFLSIDHCHNTGNIRGLLCNTCNRALGLFGDSKTLLQSAIEYLTKSNNND